MITATYGCRRLAAWFALGLTLVAPLSQAAETVTYYYTNEQGTPLATADASGNILTTSDYRPYGSQVLGSPAGGPGYTGHVNDPDSGLVYMQARYYDPVIGRFLASDPSPGDPGNPESFGRYTYASGNPVGNLDPDGRQTMPRDVYQIDWRNPQTQASVAESAAVAVAIPAVAYVAAAATAVAVDSLAAGSLTVGLTVNTEAVVTSGAIIADGAAAASGAPSGFSDEALVARGGAAANQTAEKIDAAIMPSRTPGVSGFSCQCDGGTNLATLGANIPNKQLGVTTVGAIRAVGGQVVATPGVGNHVTVTGLSGKQASPLMMIEKNPNPQPRP